MYLFCSYITHIQKNNSLECMSVGDTYFIDNCQNLNEVPYFKIQIEDYIYSLPGQLFLYKYNSSLCELLIKQDKSVNATNRWIMGTPFLNYFYQIYDLRNLQVGLVPNIYVNNQTNPQTVRVESIDTFQTKTIILSFSAFSLIFTTVWRVKIDKDMFTR